MLNWLLQWTVCKRNVSMLRTHFPLKSVLVHIGRHGSMLQVVSLSSLTSDSLITTVLNCRSPNKALELFNAAPEKNTQLYSAIIHVLVGSKLFSHARCLLKDLVENLLVKSHKPYHVSQLAFSALSRLKSSKFTPNVYGELLIVLSKMGLVEEALWMYRKVGAALAKQACNVLLDVLVKTSRFELLWRIYEEMISNGLSPDVITYGVLIDGCCRQRSFKGT